MYTAYVIVTVLAALWVGFSAFSLLTRKSWVVEPLVQYRVPESWWRWLGLAKAAGAIGMLAGLFVPFVGLLATIGVVLYFAGAAITNARAKAYGHIPFPLLYLVPAVMAYALGVLA